MGILIIVFFIILLLIIAGVIYYVVTKMNKEKNRKSSDSIEGIWESTNAGEDNTILTLKFDGDKIDVSWPKAGGGRERVQLEIVDEIGVDIITEMEFPGRFEFVDGILILVSAVDGNVTTFQKK